MQNVGIFKQAEDFRDSFISSIILDEAIQELMRRDEEAELISSYEGFDTVDQINFQKAKEELEERWRQASMILINAGV